MAAMLLLLGCTMIPGQPMMRPFHASVLSPGSGLAPLAGDQVILPRLRRDQELVYRGTYSEEGHGGRVQFGRSNRLETRIFVLDNPSGTADIAAMTLLKHRSATGAAPAPAEDAAVSVHLERVRVDLQGQLTAAPHVPLQTPLDGPPALECGVFVAMPGGHLSAAQEWSSADGDRPPLTWRVVGTEMACGNHCLKVIAEQQSDDWDQPRGDRSSWHRQDTVWLVPQLGMACRLEREIQQREPACLQAARRSKLRLELESAFQLSGQAADSRRQEIAQTLSLRESLTPLLTQPGRAREQLAALMRRIDRHLADQPETVYRPALVQLKRRVEAAQRGETPPEPVRATRPILSGGEVGQRATDFLASNFSGPGKVQLRQWLGKPIVLVFYHPSSSTSPTVLRFAQKLLVDYPRRLNVAGLSVSDDADLVRRQQAELGLTFPLLSGSGVRGHFGVRATPAIILLDGSNVIRGEYHGWAWGGETAREVRSELKRWLPLGTPLPPAPPPR